VDAVAVQGEMVGGDNAAGTTGQVLQIDQPVGVIIAEARHRAVELGKPNGPAGIVVGVGGAQPQPVGLHRGQPPRGIVAVAHRLAVGIGEPGQVARLVGLAAAGESVGVGEAYGPPLCPK